MFFSGLRRFILASELRFGPKTGFQGTRGIERNNISTIFVIHSLMVKSIPIKQLFLIPWIWLLPLQGACQAGDSDMAVEEDMWNATRYLVEEVSYRGWIYPENILKEGGGSPSWTIPALAEDFHAGT